MYDPERSAKTPPQAELGIIELDKGILLEPHQTVSVSASLLNHSNTVEHTRMLNSFYHLVDGRQIIGGSRLRIMLGEDRVIAHVGQAYFEDEAQNIKDNSQGVPLKDVLVIKDDQDVLATFWLDKGTKFEIGRSQPDQQDLPRTVSRNHCAIEVGEDGSITVENHNTLNPTIIQHGSSPVSWPTKFKLF